MKPSVAAFALSLMIVCLGSVSCEAQTEDVAKGGFRELLEIAGIGPEVLVQLSASEFTDEDWEILAQLIRRLQQQDQGDLRRWALSTQQFSPELVGELFEIEGLVENVEPLALPTEIAERLETKQLYRCRFKFRKSSAMTVLTMKIPRSWDSNRSLAEPVSFRGVLLRGGDDALFLATHLSWFPTEGVPVGKLLLARHGMDASLWDEVVQRSRFISPDRGREAEAFYSCLAAIRNVPPQEISQLTDESIAGAQVAAGSPQTKLEQQIAASVAEQAERGLSSFAALFLEPQGHVGELVRIEGVARRAVRIAVNEQEAVTSQKPIDEYFELEVFTPDSENLPLVCCVTSLPAGFPLGDAIRTRVRLEGVFFKSWKYRSRKVVDGVGETATQQQRYTPLIMAATLTWLQETPAETSWWGLVIGGAIFAAMVFGLVRMAISLKRDRRARLPDKPPDFSEL